MSCPIIERDSDKNYIEKTKDMTPPNTTPSSISPLKMATVTPNTLTDTSQHTHKSTAHKKEEERTQEPLIRMYFSYCFHPTASSHSVSLFKKRSHE